MPDWHSYVRRHLRLHGFRPEREAEIVEEVARQLEDAYSDALRCGLSEAAARGSAEEQIDDWNRLAHQLEESHRGKKLGMTILQDAAEDRDYGRRGNFTAFTDLRHDMLFGLRILKKSPGFTAVAVLTLALCIGANTAIFSIMNAVMVKSLPVRDPRNLMLLQWSARNQPKFHNSRSYGDCDSNLGKDISRLEPEFVRPRGCSLSKPFLAEVRKLGAETPSSVSAQLSYLVVGVERDGAKSSKQKSAEKLIEKGSPITLLDEKQFQALLESARQGHVPAPGNRPGAP